MVGSNRNSNLLNDGSVNTNIKDAGELAQALVFGNAKDGNDALMGAVAVETLGTAMHNAVAFQQQAQLLAAASSAATCARLLKSGVGAPPPSPPKKHEPHKTTPLPIT